MAIFFVVGCGSKNEDASSLDKAIDKLSKEDSKITSMEDYYNPKELRLSEEKVNGRLSIIYYDFDSDGEDEFLVSRVKNNDIVLSLYKYKNNELNETDSMVLFENYLDFPDVIDLDFFAKIIDEKLYIFAESISYSNLVADGLNWSLRKIGFTEDSMFFDISKHSVSGSYFDEESLDSIKDFVKGTSLSINKLVFEENGKSLFEQNSDNAVMIFNIKRDHLPDFNESLYYDSNETHVKYGETKFIDKMEDNPSLKSYLK